MDSQNAFAQIEACCERIAEKISSGMKSRGMKAANELRNASQLVLRGQRSGRKYNVPGTGRVRYYKRNTEPVGLVYHTRNSKNYKAGTATLIYKHKKGTATITYRKYTASAPGEPPAVRTGTFRNSWQSKQKITNDVSLGNKGVSVRSYIESAARTDNRKYNLGSILEDGTSRMAPRPYAEKIQKKALPKIKKIYKEPYV